MEESCLFSIIVPIYNVEEYLDRCMSSLLNQEFPKERYEILLVDDGSKDGSGIRCDGYEKQYKNVKAFHKENGGLSSARNYGLDRACGEYVLFVDSDDCLDVRACQTLAVTLEKKILVDVVVYNGIEETDSEKRRLRQVDTQKVFADGKEYLLEQYRRRSLNVEAWLYLYRREYLDQNHLRFKEGILHEDVEFTPRALMTSRNVLEIPDCLYHYVVRENSISTRKDQTKNIQDLFRTLKELDCLAEQQEWELKRWMKDALLDSYLNMIYSARMYQKRYRQMVDRRFLEGKAVTRWNKCRVLLCRCSIRLYCRINDIYKVLMYRSKTPKKYDKRHWDRHSESEGI